MSTHCCSAFFGLTAVSGLIAWLCSEPASGEEWQSRLQGGATVEVDPSTLRAWRMQDGKRTQLWDGVHRLEDGSVVIVRDGTVVPTEGMIETWKPGAPAAALPDSSPCYQLVDRVCGTDFRCSTAEPCRLANELVDLAKEELRGAPAAGGGGSSAEQCREAMTNDYFTPCE